MGQFKKVVDSIVEIGEINLEGHINLVGDIYRAIAYNFDRLQGRMFDNLYDGGGARRSMGASPVGKTTASRFTAEG
jgi:polyhydroxyalkanoate synthesis regulator phasin